MKVLNFFTQIINQILSVGKIHHLEIQKKQVSIDILIQITDLLPELDSIKMYSLSLNQLSVGSFCSKAKINKITKVYLEEMIDIEGVYLLVLLPI
jgi:hypothetical protein